MDSGVRIYDLRLSFIWVETDLDFVNGKVGPGAPLASLGRRDGYIAEFERAQKEAVGLTVPWKQDERAPLFFWSYYLEQHVPSHVKGERAWRKLVPLRGTVLGRVAAAWLPGHLTVVSFFYPHGRAFVVNAECRFDLSLERAVERAFEIRRTGRFEVEWDPEGRVRSLSLDNLAREGLGALRQYALGEEAPRRPPSVGKPFTVVTVVSGSGVDRNIAPPAQVLRALHAMAEWPSYDWQDPPPSGTPRVDEADQEEIKDRYPGDVLYFRPRGRVVWFPKHFLRKGGRCVALSCYHGNLRSLSLQIESLGDLIRETAELIGAGELPWPGSHHHWCAKRAAISLSLLYGGGQGTYRSWSARRQIEQSNLVPAINVVRDRVCDLRPLQ